MATEKEKEATPYEALEGAAFRPYESLSNIPSATAAQMVQVVAPSTLPAGYTFEASSEGKSFMVVVPEGGVKEGQKFYAPVQRSGIVAQSMGDAPVGQWKDGLCDCCQYGCCHPILCLSLFCEPIALAQIMTRLRLDWCGRFSGVGKTSHTMRNILLIFIGYMILDLVLQMLSDSNIPADQANGNYDNYSELPMVVIVCYVLHLILMMSFGFYILVLMVITRRFIREKYSIPEKHCRGCEDVCCSAFCSFCTLTQMARHTADYDKHRGMWCTETGLPSHVPIIA